MAWRCGRSTRSGRACRRRVKKRGVSCADHRRSAGRPSKEFNLKQVEALATAQCTDREIAAVLGCSRSTLAVHKREDEDFRTAIKRGRESGKASLRRLQWRAAQAGSTTMQIWLGKQWLGQRDRHEVEQTGEVTYTHRPTTPQEARQVLEQEGVIN